MFNFNSGFNLSVWKKFVQGYKSIGTRPKVTAQILTEECQRILKLRSAITKIEERDISNIHKIKNKPQC